MNTPDLAVCYSIQGAVYKDGPRDKEWEHLAFHQTEEEARLALADTQTYPLDRPLRIVEIRVVV